MWYISIFWEFTVNLNIMDILYFSLLYILGMIIYRTVTQLDNPDLRSACEEASSSPRSVSYETLVTSVMYNTNHKGL